jgi:hypothetical protein
VFPRRHFAPGVVFPEILPAACVSMHANETNTIKSACMVQVNSSAHSGVSSTGSSAAERLGLLVPGKECDGVVCVAYFIKRRQDFAQLLIRKRNSRHVGGQRLL